MIVPRAYKVVVAISLLLRKKRAVEVVEMAPNIREISVELQEAAKRNLNEVPERIEADLQALKTWIDQQPHLNPRTDDQFLVAFLRGCKYSLEKTKAKLDKYYTLRTKYPELFNVTDVNDAKLREIHRLG